MEISASDVKKLRDRTGTGMMDAKKALEDASGDFEAALDLLRKAGVVKANKKADRTTAEGTIGSYVHGNSQVAAMVVVNCETDFVARNDEFQQLAKDLAMHVAALSPLYLSREDVPQELIEKEQGVFEEHAEAEGKPANIAQKMVTGRMEKFYAEATLLEQPFVKDDSITVGELIQSAVQKLGENIQVSEFVRFEIKGNSNCQLNFPTE